MVSRLDPTLLPEAPNLLFELPLWAGGLKHVAGIDEAGRGALAGPVAAAVVILPPALQPAAQQSLLRQLAGVRDSKQLTARQRTHWAEQIRQAALAHGVGFASPQEIDCLGILPATRLAITRALAALCLPADHLLLDCLFLSESNIPQTSLIKGDCRSLSIAAASILAKTSRDALLADLERQQPGYGFAQHKGYGTAAHRMALTRLGPSPAHRLSFKLLPNLTT